MCVGGNVKLAGERGCNFHRWIPTPSQFLLAHQKNFATDLCRSIDWSDCKPSSMDTALSVYRATAILCEVSTGSPPWFDGRFFNDDSHWPLASYAVASTIHHSIPFEAPDFSQINKQAETLQITTTQFNQLLASEWGHALGNNQLGLLKSPRSSQSPVPCTWMQTQKRVQSACCNFHMIFRLPNACTRTPT